MTKRTLYFFGNKAGLLIFLESIANSLMNTYIVSSDKLKKEYIKRAESETEVRHWVINTLDLSGEWTIELSKVNL